MENNIIDSNILKLLTDSANQLADISRTIIKDALYTSYDISLKADKSFVTAVDKKVEEVLREKIRELHPDHGILGEEFGAENTDSDFVWVLDPIDGTTQFMASIPVFGSLTGLCYKKRPVIGVIEAPATNDRWIGISNKETTFNGKKVRVRNCAKLEDAYLTNSNPDFMSENEFERFLRLKEAVAHVQYGGDCYAYGCLASGKTDAAIDSGLDIHDICAIVPVITGAGGIISDWSGREIDLDWSGDVLACNNSMIHDEAVSKLK